MFENKRNISYYSIKGKKQSIESGIFQIFISNSTKT